MMSRNEADWWSPTDVGANAGQSPALCEGWWNRSDISPELQREIPAGTEQRGGDKGGGRERREVRPLRGNVIL